MAQILPFFWYSRRWFATIVLLTTFWFVCPAIAEDLKFSQIIKIRYEATDPQIGGQFIIWSELEKIWYRLDSKLFPTAKSVEVTHITPAPGTTILTIIAVTSVNSTTPYYFHLSGNVRFKISGITVTSSNLP